MIESKSDDSLVDTLRSADLPVALNAAELTKRISNRRRQQKTRRLVFATALPVGIALVVVWSTIGMPDRTPNSANPSLVQLEPRGESNEQPSTTPNSVDLARFQQVVDYMEKRDLLARKKDELWQLEKQTDRLRNLRSRQTWALKRELISRTEIKPDVAAIRF